jgi:hypothetical protein
MPPAFALPAALVFDACAAFAASLVEVRRRNQVIAYSDDMNSYHAEMELVINGGRKAVQGSMDDLQAALFAQDAPAAKAAIRKLKAPCGKLFLKFG